MIIEGENQKSKTEMEISQNEIKGQKSNIKIKCLQCKTGHDTTLNDHSRGKYWGFLKEIYKSRESEEGSPGFGNQGKSAKVENIW